MTTRRVFLKSAVGWGAALGLVPAAGLSLAGCGGSMGSSASDLTLSSFEALGNPQVEIQPTEGSGTTGSFEVPSFDPQLRVNEPIFIIARYRSQVPNVNRDFFNDPDPPPIGIFDASWSVLRAPASGVTVTLGSSVGTTFTGFVGPSASPHVLLTGESGNFVHVSGTATTPVSVTLRITVNLQLADGSRRSKTFDVDLTVLPPAPASS